MEEADSVARRLSSALGLYQAEYGEPFPAESVAAVQATVQPQLSVQGPLTGASWFMAVAKVLNDAGRPLHVKNIWHAMQQGGFQTDARDPVRSVVATCVRSPVFQKVGPNTYELIYNSPGEFHDDEGGDRAHAGIEAEQEEVSS